MFETERVKVGDCERKRETERETERELKRVTNIKRAFKASNRRPVEGERNKMMLQTQITKKICSRPLKALKSNKNALASIDCGVT